MQYPYDAFNRKLAKEHPERGVSEAIDQGFYNVRNGTHTLEGERKEGTKPVFTDYDAVITGVKGLREPPGSWLGTHSDKNGAPKGAANKLTASLPMTEERL